LNETCFIGFECFEACPPAILNASSTAQPSTYRISDHKDIDHCITMSEANTTIDMFDSTKASFSCEGDWADLQVRIRYDVDELDGRVVEKNSTTGKVGPVDYVNVDFKGTVEQVSPLNCSGTFIFVKGTLVGSLFFDASGPDGKYVPVIERPDFRFVPELFLTSSAPLGNMDFTILSVPGNATDDECFRDTQKFSYRKRGRAVNDGNVISRLVAVPTLEVEGSEDLNGTPEVYAFVPIYETLDRDKEERGLPRLFQSSITGPLLEVCQIKEKSEGKDSTAVQIQCLAHEPIELVANGAVVDADEAFLKTIARVQTKNGPDSGLKLQSQFVNINCSCQDIERFENETAFFIDPQNSEALIVRTIPLSVDVDGDKVEEAH